MSFIQPTKPITKIPTYRTCPFCNTKVLITDLNKTGECLYRLCDGNKRTEGSSQSTTYLGKQHWSSFLDDVITCIDAYGQDLVCITVGEPTIMLLTKSQFNNF